MKIVSRYFRGGDDQRVKKKKKKKKSANHLEVMSSISTKKIWTKALQRKSQTREESEFALYHVYDDYWLWSGAER